MRQPARFLSLLRISVAVIAASMVFGALAGEARKPKQNFADPRLDSRNLFSAPEQSADQTPTFISGNGRPLASSRVLRTPDFNVVRQLPSISDKQRQEVNRLDRELTRRQTLIKIATTEMQEHLAKATDQTERSAFKDQIAQLSDSADDARKSAFSDLQAVLSDSQRQDYEDMRHGELMIEPRQLPDPRESGGK